MRRLAISILIVLGLSWAALPAQAEPVGGYRAQSVHVEWVIHHGWLTSSIYFTERATRWICNEGPAGLAVISPIPHPVANVMKAGAALLIWKACQAKEDVNCLRIRFAHYGGIVGLYNVPSANEHCRRDWRNV